MSLINLVERYNTNEFEFDLKSKEYKGTYCSVWFKKDVESDWLVVADESNCVNSALWGYKFIDIDFTWRDKISLDETKNRVFSELRKLIGSDFEDKLYKFEKTIHVKQFYQGTLNHAYAIYNNEKIKIDDDVVSNKVCEIWCEANWNGNTGRWETSVENMEIKNYQRVSAGCPYYIQESNRQKIA